MHILRSFPTESVVYEVIFRRRTQIFRASYNVGDTHKVIVHDVCEVISGQTVALEKNAVLYIRAVAADFSENHILRELFDG